MFCGCRKTTVCHLLDLQVTFTPAGPLSCHETEMRPRNMLIMVLTMPALP
jgi:hypothetical protein